MSPTGISVDGKPAGGADPSVTGDKAAAAPAESACRFSRWTGSPALLLGPGDSNPEAGLHGRDVAHHRPDAAGRNTAPQQADGDLTAGLEDDRARVAPAREDPVRAAGRVEQDFVLAEHHMP